MFTEYQRETLDEICRLIFREFSKTVGVAFLKLDCDCVKLVGVSSVGEPTSPMMSVSGNPPVIDEETGEESEPVCDACSQDNLGIFRVKKHGIIWNDATVKVSKKRKDQIKIKVFESRFEKVR